MADVASIGQAAGMMWPWKLEHLMPSTTTQASPLTRGRPAAAGAARVAAWLLAVASAAAGGAAGAGDDDPDPDESLLSAELRALIEPGTRLFKYRVADLNRDGRPDLVYILHRLPPSPQDDELEERQRPLRIALRGADGRLRVVVNNETLVQCHTCGGIWPEPFDELSAGPGEFTVGHYGGSRWRWSDRWRFVYDAQARTWFLDRVQLGQDVEAGGHQVSTYVRGRHFGALRIDRFEREEFHTHHLRQGVPPLHTVRDDSRS